MRVYFQRFDRGPFTLPIISNDAIAVIRTFRYNHNNSLEYGFITTTLILPTVTIKNMLTTTTPCQLIGAHTQYCCLNQYFCLSCLLIISAQQFLNIKSRLVTSSLKTLCFYGAFMHESGDWISAKASFVLSRIKIPRAFLRFVHYAEPVVVPAKAITHWHEYGIKDKEKSWSPNGLQPFSWLRQPDSNQVILPPNYWLALAQLTSVNLCSVTNNNG